MLSPLRGRWSAQEIRAKLILRSWTALTDVNVKRKRRNDPRRSSGGGWEGRDRLHRRDELAAACLVFGNYEHRAIDFILSYDGQSWDDEPRTRGCDAP